MSQIVVQVQGTPNQCKVHMSREGAQRGLSTKIEKEQPFSNSKTENIDDVHRVLLAKANTVQ